MAQRKLEYLDDAEIHHLITAIQLDTATGIRNLAIILLMLDGGCKVSELVGQEISGQAADAGDAGGAGTSGLRTGDIDWGKGLIRVKKQNNNSVRAVPLQQETLEAMRKWEALRPRTDTDLFFTSLKGKKMQNRYVREFLADYANKASIGKRVRPSMLRHTYAKKLFEESKNINLVRKRLGHINLTSTALYAMPEGEDE